MKKLILFYFLWIASFVFSQTYISETYITAVNYSIKISYSGSSYSYSKPYSSTQHYAQATLQARYDYNHQWCSNEYWAVKNLTLVNASNRATLNNYRNQRLPWVYNAIKTWNLGVDQNAYTIINYCCEIFSYPAIKDEISILKAINGEIHRLKRTLPGEYHLSKRYQELSVVLTKLNGCSPSEINTIAWNYGLL